MILPLGKTDLLLLVVSLVATSLVYLRSKRRSVLPYPPGPRKLPLLENLLDIPTNLEWETYARWGKEYNSDVIHIRAAGHDIIVLNSFKAAIDLLDKKSAIYSSRPQFTMITELMGWKWVLFMLAYGKAWKERRRLFQKYFSNRNVDVYRTTQMEFVRKMLAQLLRNPKEFLSITQNMTGASTLSLTYGLDIQEANDPFIDLSTRALETVARAGAPGAFLVDLMPWLKYVPEWVPGAGFQKTAREWRELQKDVRELPYAKAVHNAALGQGKPSFVSECLETLHEYDDVEHQLEVIKDTAGTVFAAGGDTTLSTIHTFFVAMLYFPEAQKKAQEELDLLLRGRLPNFADQGNLPYVTALVKEILRWKPVAPLGLPHYADEDNVYGEYLIPKGALVMANAWAMLQNEESYPVPHIFNPGRFLDENEQLNSVTLDPSLIAFGFGRRLCPGRHVATSLLWLTVATILATFDILREVDEAGVLIEPSVRYHSGMMSHPLPFKCTIKPRSKGSVKRASTAEGQRQMERMVAPWAIASGGISGTIVLQIPV